MRDYLWKIAWKNYRQSVPLDNLQFDFASSQTWIILFAPLPTSSNPKHKQTIFYKTKFRYNGIIPMIYIEICYTTTWRLVITLYTTIQMRNHIKTYEFLKIILTFEQFLFVFLGSSSYSKLFLFLYFPACNFSTNLTSESVLLS